MVNPIKCSRQLTNSDTTKACSDAHQCWAK